MTGKKITDDELRELVENNVKFGEIKDRHGYVRNESLNKRLRDLGFCKLRKVSFYSKGGANISIRQSVLEAWLESNGIDAEKSRDGTELFYKTELNEEKGVLEVVPSTRQLVEDEVD